MPIQSIGHAVLKVRNAKRAEEFYNGVLGLPVAARRDNPSMIFFTLGNHHDFAVLEVGDNAPAPDPRGVGLYHVAFKVGNTLEELRAMKEQILERGGKIDHFTDHNATYSIYLYDPDGNGLELYVDVSDAWKQDPSLVTTIAPLEV